MSFRKNLAQISGLPEEQLPSSYQIIGNILLAKFLTTPEEKKKAVAEAIIRILPYVKTVCEIKGVKGEFRQPIVSLLIGNSTETIHKESRILFKLDVSKIMFSKGNHFERKRLLSKVKNNETILDMFAGIGYFTIPLSKKVKKVISIEKNPVAFKYLNENISLNNSDNIEPIIVDCSKFETKEKPDRIIMGYFPETEKFIESAKRFVKSGTVVHFHNSYKKDTWEIDSEKHAKLFGNIEILEKRIVKSLSPSEVHVVIDIKII